MRNRLRGALIGLAVGDAVGTTVEFKVPGTFPPVTDMTGGGKFRLKAGQWTDDTSMALCLAESLIECKGFDARDQMERYVRWLRQGYLSSTGTHFDIGPTTRASLERFVQSGDPYSGSTDEWTAGNGSIMRLAPIPMFHARDARAASQASGESSRTTHATPVAVDACRYLGALIAAAIAGATKEELLSPDFEPAPGSWEAEPLNPVIADILGGSFKRKEPPAIKGSTYVAESLEAALWAFNKSTSFRDGLLLAVNLGNDADTTGAVYGQIAGAFYGENAIPEEWRSKLALYETIDNYADALSVLAQGTNGERNA